MKAKSYQDLNFILNHDASQFMQNNSINYSSFIDKFKNLDRLDLSNELDINIYNEAVIEAYSEFDSSEEFKLSVGLSPLAENRTIPDFDDIVEVYPELSVPYLDQTAVSSNHFAPHQRYWAKHGYLLIEGMIDSDVCDEFLELREKENLELRPFPSFTPYLKYDVIKRMFCSIEMNMLLNDLIGEELGLHFNLSNFTSTERGWHQDEYLNPPGAYGRYIAAWIAVDEITIDSGPFEFIDGSHKWPSVSRNKVMPYLKNHFQAGEKNSQDWAGYAAMFVNPAYFKKFATNNIAPTKFLGKKGDVLLWHSRLIHRGSPPLRRNVRRPGIIGHYSAIRNTRWFGGDIRRYGNGGYYWNFD